MKRSVIDTVDLSKEEVQGLLDTAMDIIADPAVISMTDAGTSSATKGETVADTVKVVSNYVDIIAQRHPKAGAALVSAVNAQIPVINAGDGGHCHPTQTFADLLTIYREYGKMDGLTIGFCGDLLYGRTVHSLMSAMARYEGTKFVLISPDELKVPRHLIDDVVTPNSIPCEETASLEDALPKLDVLYMTRIQKERFDDIAQYERLKNSYVLDAEKMKLAKPDCIVMHPLPRVDEIAVEVDEDPRARYFEQTLNGKYMRMALILKLLGDQDPANTYPGGPFSLWNEAVEDGAYRCTNPKCICAAERSIRHKYYTAKDGSKRCVYCEQ